MHVLHAWGMTEMSPLGTVCTLKGKHASLSNEQRLAHPVASRGAPSSVWT